MLSFQYFNLRNLVVRGKKNNTKNSLYGAVLMAQPVVRVHPVYAMNAE